MKHPVQSSPVQADVPVGFCEGAGHGIQLSVLLRLAAGLLVSPALVADVVLRGGGAEGAYMAGGDMLRVEARSAGQARGQLRIYQRVLHVTGIVHCPEPLGRMIAKSLPARS